MSPRNILLIHHTKDFNSNYVYQTDNYLEANRRLFGAQELDTWAGYRILQNLAHVYRLQICPNYNQYQLVYHDRELLHGKLYPESKPFAKPSFSYYASLLRYWDPSIAKQSNIFLSQTIKRLIDALDISLIWADTQFYESLIPNSITAIVRSVNFEPHHVLKEDSSIFKYMRFFGKVYSERIISKRHKIVSISPRDSANYRRISFRDSPIIPLRQLPFLLDTNFTTSPSSRPNLDFEYFHFSGSSYDVLHNRKNLEQILYEVAPLMAKSHPNAKILVFGHRFPPQFTVPSNVIRMLFRDDYYDLIRHSQGAIVPYSGGAGMQSKIFEPLTLGIPLIANPKALSGYPFRESIHFQSASHSKQIAHSMDLILRNKLNVEQMTNESKVMSNYLFDRKVIEYSLEKILCEVSI